MMWIGRRIRGIKQDFGLGSCSFSADLLEVRYCV